MSDPGTTNPAELLRLLDLIPNGTLCRAAVVLFGQSERIREDMSQCMVRIARIRNVARMDYQENKHFYGNAFDLLGRMQQFLRETLPIAGRIVPGQLARIDEPLYPPLATYAALENALCHRDYSFEGTSIGLAVYDNRLEVKSPGPLHFGLAPQELLASHESAPWNPLVARVFYLRGLIGEWGEGMQRMRVETEAAGLPQPEIIDSGSAVTVRFRHWKRDPFRG